MLCKFLLYRKVNQLCVYMYPLFVDLLPAEQAVEFPELFILLSYLFYT